MNDLFSGLFLNIAVWATKQALGTKRGTEALAHAAPILVPLAAAAGNAASVQIDHAAQTGGNLAAVAALVEAQNN